MSNIDYGVPAVMRYACSACPACSCGARNAAQEAVAAAVAAVRVSAASNTVPLTPPPAGFWGKENRPTNSEQRCSNWPAGATDHACTKCNPGEIDRLNKLGAETSVGRYDETPTMGVLNLGTASGGRIEMGSIHMPEKSFTRSEVLAVLKARRILYSPPPHDVGANRELDALITIFERMG